MVKFILYAFGCRFTVGVSPTTWVLIGDCLSSAGEHTEYTEVPLSDLDITAPDSLTLSPHHGELASSAEHWTDGKTQSPWANVLLKYTNFTMSQKLCWKAPQIYSQCLNITALLLTVCQHVSRILRKILIIWLLWQLLWINNHEGGSSPTCWCCESTVEPECFH